MTVSPTIVADAVYGVHRVPAIPALVKVLPLVLQKWADTLMTFVNPMNTTNSHA